jgi:hypothetical protein
VLVVLALYDSSTHYNPYISRSGGTNRITKAPQASNIADEPTRRLGGRLFDSLDGKTPVADMCASERRKVAVPQLRANLPAH